MGGTIADYRRDALMNLSRRINRPLVGPDWISLNLTLRCNLRCVMCRTCYPESDELTCAEVKEVIDQAAAWGVGVFNPLGGEPFLRPDVMEILAYGAGRGLLVTVTTNGTLIDGRRARALAGLPRVHLNVSLDGLEESNDAVRGKGVFARALGAIADVRSCEGELRDELGGAFVPKEINVNCIVNRLDADELVEFARAMRGAGASKVQFLALSGGRGGDARPAGDSLWFGPADYRRLDRAIDALCAAIGEGRLGIPVVNSPRDLRLMKLYYRGELRPDHAPCYNGFKELYINANGDGLMCDGHMNFLAGSFGNVRRQTLRQMWSSREARRMRRKVLTCRRACISDCYLRRESDDLEAIALRAAARLGSLLLSSLRGEARGP